MVDFTPKGEKQLTNTDRGLDTLSIPPTMGDVQGTETGDGRWQMNRKTLPVRYTPSKTAEEGYRSNVVPEGSVC